MKKFLIIQLILFIAIRTSGQVVDISTISNRGWANTVWPEEDTVWVATQGGLLKFLDDGTYLRTYYTSDGLLHNTVTAFAIDQNGNKWLGSKNRGITMINETSIENYKEFIRMDTEIGDILVDSNNRLWFATPDGVFMYDQSSWSTFRTTNSGLRHNLVFCVSEDKHGNIWFGTREGVVKYDGSEWESWDPVDLPIFSIDFEQDNVWIAHWRGFSKFDGTAWTHYNKDQYPELESGDILSMAVEGDTIWLGTYYNGIRYVQNGTISGYNEGNSELLPGRIQDIFIDSDGAKYFVSGDLYTDGGVSRLKDGIWTIFQADSSLAPSFTMTTCVDNEDNTWVGSYGGGLAMYNGNKWTRFTDQNSVLTSNTIHKICKERTGRLWFATFSGICSLDGGLWTNHQGELEAPGGRVYDLAIDQNNKLWAATDDGLYSFNGSEWNRYSTENSGIVSNDLYNVAVDSFNNIWAGSFDMGLSMFDHTNWSGFNVSSGHFEGDYINEIEVDKDNRVWVSVQGNGVYRYFDNEWTNLNSSNTGLLHDAVLSIGVVPDGSIWFGYIEGNMPGYMGGGLSVLSATGWSHYTSTNSDLVHDNVNSIYFDNNGFVWVGTLFGISVFNYQFPPPVIDNPGETRIISLYPNPSKDKINIELPPGDDRVMKYLLYSLSGNTMKEGTVLSRTFELNISGLAQGVYLLQITDRNDKALFSGKFVKE